MEIVEDIYKLMGYFHRMKRMALFHSGDVVLIGVQYFQSILLTPNFSLLTS